MELTHPAFLYKYRPINNSENLAEDYAIDGIINNYAIFSSRTNFNDLFDSKIDLIKPTPQEIKALSKLTNKSYARQLLTHIYKGKWTPNGELFMRTLEKQFNEVIDSYAFMSLSSRPDSNLMWSHYALSHRGFCIEFDAEYVRGRKVEYTDDIPSLGIIELLKFNTALQDDIQMAEKILSALHCKLREWDYESEYRFLARKEMATIGRGQKFMKVKYEPNWIHSIIFGYRMDENVKQYMIENLPQGMKFKQAMPGRNSMIIENH